MRTGDRLVSAPDSQMESVLAAGSRRNLLNPCRPRTAPAICCSGPTAFPVAGGREEARFLCKRFFSLVHRAGPTPNRNLETSGVASSAARISASDFGVSPPRLAVGVTLTADDATVVTDVEEQLEELATAVISASDVSVSPPRLVVGVTLTHSKSWQRQSSSCVPHGLQQQQPQRPRRSAPQRPQL